MDKPEFAGHVEGGVLISELLPEVAESSAPWDEAKWLAENPRPAFDSRHPNVRRWQANKENARKRASKPGYDSIGKKIFLIDVEEWIRQNPPPYPDVRPIDMTKEQKLAHDRWNTKKNLATNPGAREKQHAKGVRQRAKPGARAKAAERSRKWREDNPERHAALVAKQNNDPKVRQRKVERETARVARLSDKERAERTEQRTEAKRKRIANETAEQREARLLQNRKDASRTRAKRVLRDCVYRDDEAIADVFECAQLLEWTTGITMDVDHVIPLLGDFVSGLHHQNNLWILPADANRKKNNAISDAELSLSASKLFLSNNYRDHTAFLESGADLIAERRRDKAKKAVERSKVLDKQILNPRTKLGRTARALWGSDAARMIERLTAKER